jgi:glyoxylase-like metal-dependent hydrolase (beta-lactamase superfamily II)
MRRQDNSDNTREQKAMPGTSFHFSLGELGCSVISDGLLTVGPGIMEISCLLIRTKGKQILIDTGCGVSVQVKAGTLVRNMQAADIEASEIDTIIHTHAHSDHIGGNTDTTGLPNFPKARHIMHKIEWEYWMDRLNKPQSEGGKWQPMLATARKNLAPLRDRFDIVEGSPEIAPGIKLIPAPGHTPGNLMVKLSSGGSELVCAGDLIHDPLEFKKPEMYAVIDYSAELALTTRNEIMTQAAEAKAPVYACHFPFPGLGHVSQNTKSFDWHPINSAGEIVA